jgi:hypothetical protein
MLAREPFLLHAVRAAPFVPTARAADLDVSPTPDRVSTFDLAARSYLRGARRERTDGEESGDCGSGDS